MPTLLSMLCLVRLTVLTGAVFYAAAVGAEPTVLKPAPDTQLLELVAPGNRDPAWRLARRTGSGVRTEQQFLNSARDHLTRAYQIGDSRALGRAESILLHASLRSNPQARLMRANVLQSRHAFKAALRELDPLLDRTNANDRAWLLKGNIHRVQGQLGKALSACERAFAIQANPTNAICAADVAALSGQPDKSEDWLEQAVALSGASPLTAQNALVLAEMAIRRNEPDQALRYFQLALAEPSVYTQDSFARWLLSRNQAQAVVKLFTAQFDTIGDAPDTLLVRLAMAYQASGQVDELATVTTLLNQRFSPELSTTRTPHWRERAEYQLHILEQPEAALASAQKNWRDQRESADVLILTKAAQSSNDHATLASIRQFVRESGFTDDRLTMLLGEQ